MLACRGRIGSSGSSLLVSGGGPSSLATLCTVVCTCRVASRRCLSWNIEDAISCSSRLNGAGSLFNRNGSVHHLGIHT